MFPSTAAEHRALNGSFLPLTLWWNNNSKAVNRVLILWNSIHFIQEPNSIPANRKRQTKRYRGVEVTFLKSSIQHHELQRMHQSQTCSITSCSEGKPDAAFTSLVCTQARSQLHPASNKHLQEDLFYGPAMDQVTFWKILYKQSNKKSDSHSKHHQ